MSSFSFDPTAMDAILNQPEAQQRMGVLASPTLLEIAKANCSVPYPGEPARNPAPGQVNGQTGVYMRGDGKRRAPGQFRDTLQLEISVTGDLVFSSPAISARKGFAYGQALIAGRAPFIGAYRLLPPEYYV